MIKLTCISVACFLSGVGITYLVRLQFQPLPEHLGIPAARYLAETGTPFAAIIDRLGPPDGTISKAKVELNHTNRYGEHADSEFLDALRKRTSKVYFYFNDDCPQTIAIYLVNDDKVEHQDIQELLHFWPKN